MTKYYKFNLLCPGCREMREVRIPESEKKPISQDRIKEYAGPGKCETCGAELPGMIAIPEIAKMINTGTFPVRDLEERIPQVPKSQDLEIIKAGVKKRY